MEEQQEDAALANVVVPLDPQPSAPASAQSDSIVSMPPIGVALRVDPDAAVKELAAEDRALPCSSLPSAEPGLPGSLGHSSGSNKNLGILFEQTMSHVEEIAEDSVVEMISVRRDANDELREMADQTMSLVDEEMSHDRQRIEVVVPKTTSQIQQPKPGWRTY